jgi:hypothetical protein
MANRLRKLVVDFVSLVDRPANQPAEIVLTKRGDPASSDDTTTTPSATSTPQESTVPNATEAQPITKADLDAAIAEAIQKASSEYETKIEKLTTDLETANGRAQTAEQVAKAEQEARETSDAITKAQRDYPTLPGTTPAEIAPILRKASKTLSAEEFEKLDEVLKAASVAVGKSDIFKEHGSSGNNTTGAKNTAEAQLQNLAKELREKDSALTPQAAIVKAMDARPDLVDLDRVEKGFRPAR